MLVSKHASTALRIANCKSFAFRSNLCQVFYCIGRSSTGEGDGNHTSFISTSNVIRPICTSLLRGHCGKSKYFALELRDILMSKATCSGLSA